MPQPGRVQHCMLTCAPLTLDAPLLLLSAARCLQSTKSIQLRKIVSEQFRVNRDEVDPARIHVLTQM